MQHRWEDGAGRFRPTRWELTASRGARAPLAPATLVGALSLGEEDLRRNGTCAPASMAGSAACPTAMGDRLTARERATQVTATQVSGAGSERAWHYRRWGKGHGVVARRTSAGKRVDR
jgi:hypothetical protein